MEKLATETMTLERKGIFDKNHKKRFELTFTIKDSKKKKSILVIGLNPASEDICTLDTTTTFILNNLIPMGCTTITKDKFLKRREELNQQLSSLWQRQSETSILIMGEEKKEIPKEVIRNILQNFSKVLSSDIDRTIRKRLLHLLISEITIDQHQNIESIKLKLLDELIWFLQDNGGTPPDGAPSVFVFREFGIKSLELELVI